jgi:UDP-glucose 4-epimerase
MRILITGGCGFIGINLIAYLRQRNSDHLTVLDNLSEGNKENLGEFDVEFVEGDIRDIALVKRTMQGMDAVIHLAADTRVVDSIENPDYNFDVNVFGTYNLLSAARLGGVGKFVMASTGGAIVGDVTPPVREDMVPKPISPYGASKLCGEAYCSAFAGAYGMKTVCLRFSNVYGPRSFHKGSVVAHFFKQILQGNSLKVYGNGEQTRDFVFVDDISAGIAGALIIEEGGNAYQLGTGAETSVNELIRMIQRCVADAGPVSVGYEPARKGEVLRNYCDISLARKGLGFSPQVELPEGLARTWEWFLAHKPASDNEVTSDLD